MISDPLSAIGKMSGVISAARAVRTLLTTSLLAVLLAGGALSSAPGPAWAASFLERAQQYFDEGDLDSAVVELKNALQRNPDDAEARFLLGKVHLQRGDPAAAEKELTRAQQLGYEGKELDVALAYARLRLRQFQQVIDVVPEDIPIESAMQRELYVARGEALVSLGKFDEAQEIFDRILAGAPHARALLGKARITMALGDTETARGYLDKARELDPDDPEIVLQDAIWLFHNQAFDEAKTGFERVIEIDPSYLNAYLGRIQSLLVLGDLEEADKTVRRLLEGQPNNFLIVLHNSIVQFMRGNYREAKTAADQVLSANESQPQALIIAGYSAFQLEEYAQARARLTAYVSQYPADERARMTLGATWLRLGDAKKAYEVVGSSNIEVPDTMAYLSLLTSTAFGAGDRQAGLRYLERLVAKNPNNYDLQERLGVIHLTLGQPNEAIEAFERARDIDPTRTQAYARLFSAYIQQRDTANARAVAQATADRLPDSSLGQTLLGLAYLAAEDPKEAESAFQAALDKEPGSAVAAMNLANLYKTQGKFNEARQAYDAVLSKNPGHLRTLLAYAKLEEDVGEISQAQILLKEAIEANPEAVEPELFLGNLLIRAQEPSKAAQGLNAALAKHPNSLSLRESLGNAQLAAGRAAAAVETYRGLAQRAPSSPKSHLHLMEGLERLGRYNDAIAASERVLALDPNNAAAGVTRARLLARQQRMDEAKAQLAALRARGLKLVEIPILEGRIALAERRPDDAEKIFTEALKQNQDSALMYELMRTKFARGQGNEALGLARAWLEDHPEDVTILNALGAVLLRSGHYEEAKARYQSIVSVEPRNAEAVNNVAWAQLNLGEHQEAVKMARRAVELAPDNANFLDTLGMALLEADQADDAVSTLLMAKGKAPESPGIRFHLASALAKSGDTTAAIDELEQLLEASKQFTGREHALALLEQLKK